MTTENLSIQNQINVFVKVSPNHAMPILKDLGIDLCCGGAKTLKVVCEEKRPGSEFDFAPTESVFELSVLN